ELLPGPDFPTGGVLADDPATIAAAYATGRGSLRLRARWHEEAGNIIVTEIPWQVPKGKLIEQVAALINEKKLPGLADIRDESDAQVRILLEPRARSVDRALLMEQLFRLTDLETRISVNLNVLDGGRVPRVMDLRGLIQAFLDHQLSVLVARSRHRLARIEARLELLGGFLVAYLNLDAVLKIVREADRPKEELIAAFGLTPAQAQAILDMRLRALNKLERIAIEREAEGLKAEQAELAALLDSPRRQKAQLKAMLAEAKAAFADPRRTSIAAAPRVEVAAEAFIAREPVTVIVSAMGWARAMKGHVELGQGEALRFKEGDGPAFAFHAQTTDRLLVAASTGRAYNLVADRLPGGRGHGEPLRLMLDIPAEADIVWVGVADPAARWLLVASDGRGFVAKGEDLLAETRKGRVVMTPRAGARLAVVRRIPDGADHVALVGHNRRLAVIPLAMVPELARGQGVQLQRYKGGVLSDAVAFRLAEGLSWSLGERRRTLPAAELEPWLASRGGGGRTVPQDFPRSDQFDLEQHSQD
ncbi:MAG: DNA gyrase subunit A, partial [Sphingomonadaceae bacterium]